MFDVFINRKQLDPDPDLLVQLDVFDEHKANDDEECPGTKGVDLNSPLDVFHAISKQVIVSNATLLKIINVVK